MTLYCLRLSKIRFKRCNRLQSGNMCQQSRTACVWHNSRAVGRVSFMHFSALRAFLTRSQGITEEIQTLATIQDIGFVSSRACPGKAHLYKYMKCGVTVPLPMCNHRLSFRLSQRHFYVSSHAVPNRSIKSSNRSLEEGTPIQSSVHLTLSQKRADTSSSGQSC